METTAPPATAPKARFYRPELDALRFFAFFSVFLKHTPASRYGIIRVIQGAGSYGVCLFFFLSAFLITELFWRERERTGDIHLKAFYIRRVLRIWPLYFFALFLAWLLGVILPFHHVEGGRLLASLLLAGNWYSVIWGWSVNPIIFPLWSISVEEQFYLVTPVIARWGGIVATNAVSYVALAASYATLLYLGHLPDPEKHSVWANSLVQFQYFAAGALTANYLRGRVPKFGVPLRALLFLVGAGFWIVACRLGINIVLRPGASPYDLSLGYGAILLGTLAIFFAFLGWQRSLPKAALYLGTISYGLYVYHTSMIDLMDLAFKNHMSLPFVAILKAGLALGLTCGCAAISYHLFELPFVRMKKRFTFVASKAE